MITIFLPSLRGGGAERVQLHLARRFAEQGHDVELVVVNLEGGSYPLPPKNVRVVNLGKQRVLSSLPSLIRYLKENRPAAILSALDHCNLVALYAVKLARIRASVVISVHNTLSISSKRSNWKDRVTPYLARISYRHANAIVAVSMGVADDLAATISVPRHRISVIYNPIVTPELFESADKPTGHEWLDVADTPVLVAVGRLEEQKDYSTLLQAFAIVVKSCRVRLLILGQGAERSNLEALIRELGIEDTVELYGFSNNPFAFMSKARLLVLSSRYEGFGNVIVEAMALNVPVVATDCPHGPAEVLDDGKFGSLVPVGDSQRLASAIIDELTSPKESLNLRQRAREFSYEKIGDEYLDLITEVSGV